MNELSILNNIIETFNDSSTKQVEELVSLRENILNHLNGVIDAMCEDNVNVLLKLNKLKSELENR